MSDIEIIRTEEVIAAEIRVIKEQTRVAVLSGAIEIGRRLAEAKAIVPHGQWGAWHGMSFAMARCVERILAASKRQNGWSIP